MNSISTKTGDDGTTSLMFGHRVPKTDPRVVAVGSCDELNAALGMVRAFVREPAITTAVFAIQKELVRLMGELAVVEEDRDRYDKGGFSFVTDEMVNALAQQIDELEKDRGITYEHWATPGSTQGSAVLDVARTTCRRAERAVCECRERGLRVEDTVIRYLNRLSDLCWLWARWVESKPSV